MALYPASCHHCCYLSKILGRHFYSPLSSLSSARNIHVKTLLSYDKYRLSQSEEIARTTNLNNTLSSKSLNLLFYHRSGHHCNRLSTLFNTGNKIVPHQSWYHSLSAASASRSDVYCDSFIREVHVKVPLLVRTTFPWMCRPTRSYHGSKFNIQNPVFSSYLNSLVEEFKAVSSDTSDQSKKDNSEQQAMRFNFLRSAAEIIERVQAKQAEMLELSTVMSGEEDQEMKKMVEREMEKYKEEMEELEEELVDVLVGEDPADSNDIILEINAGVGGQEAMLFCAEMYNMYCNYARYKGWNITGLSIEENELGGTRKASVEISGQDVYKHLKHEAGVHRVQRVPKTEKAGRIHTSTITVAVLPQPREIDVDIQAKDLKIDTFRGSGPGGQSVNTTDSAVRITHIPTGIVSECKQERSQIKNREYAMRNLKRKIYQTILEEEELKRCMTRKMHMGTRARSEKIRTYNFQQDRITDHRVKENCSNLVEFMIGGEGLDNLIDSLNSQDKFVQLESMVDEYELEMSRKKSGKS